MLGSTYPGQDCSAARALEIVGERWTLLILRDAMFRNHVRYSEFAESLGVASNILVKRLETLVAAGLMEMRPGEARSSHREYHLTEKGRDMMTVVVALTEWGDRWLGPGPVEFREGRGGPKVILRMTDAVTAREILPASVVAQRR